MPGKPPTIVVDVDNTILDPSRRKARAFIDAVRSTGSVIVNPATVKKINAASRSSFDFGPMKKIVDKEIDDLVFRRFLSNEYLVMHGRVMDDPVPGSVKFLNDAVANGCRVAYVSGRSHDEWQDKRKKSTPFTGMVPGTIESLRKLGYPVPAYPSSPGDPVTIAFKESRGVKDENYKPAEIRNLNGIGDVVAVFEDNKKVLDAVKKGFPNISRVAVLIYPGMKANDFGCLPRSQRKITEYMAGAPVRGGVECVKDFSAVKVRPGCNIIANKRAIT
jgi:hypothetical protein